MIKVRLTASAIAAAGFGATLLSVGAAFAAMPTPAPSLIRPEVARVQARMKRHMMKRSMMRRGGDRTISTKLDVKMR